MVQHGGGGYGLLDIPIIKINDFEQVENSAYIMWGEGLKDCFDGVSKKYHVRVYPLGSPMIKKIYTHRKQKNRVKNHIKTIYYLCQNYRESNNSI